jgi:hypothetical protein
MLKSFVGIIPKWCHATTSKKEPKEKRKDNIGPKTLESLHTQINQKELVWYILGVLN